MSNIIDSIQLSGVTYDLAGSGGVSESAFTAYTAATDTVLANKADLSAATITSTSETSTTGTYYVYKMLSFEYDDGAYLFSATTEDDYPFEGFSVTLKDAPNGNTVNIYLNTSTGETDSYILTESEYQSGSRTYTTRTVTTKGNYRITYASIATDGGGFSYDYGYKTRTVSSKAVSTYIEEDINPTLSGKVDSSTYTVYTAATDTALAGKQTTLTAGTGINITDNVISATGGGGKAIEAGRGISITTGETADTVSFNLPIYDRNNKSTSECHEQNVNVPYCSSNFCHLEQPDGGIGSISNSSHKEGINTRIGNYCISSHVEGYYSQINNNSSYSHAEGYYTKINNEREHASGSYNVSNIASTTFGNSGNTLFSVGNGTADNARHNAFEIRQNGDIYISKDGSDVKLQDQLGGGGGGGEGTVSALTETNPVALNGDYSTYYTATTIDTFYIKSFQDTSFNNFYIGHLELSNNEQLDIYATGNKNCITSVSASTAYTSTITDGIAEIKLVSPLGLRRVIDTNRDFLLYYFPQTPYTSGSTSEVVEGAVYDSLRKLSLDVLGKNRIITNSMNINNGYIASNLETDDGQFNAAVKLASPTIRLDSDGLNVQFSSSTVSQMVLNGGNGNYCELFYDKSYNDITITFNSSYIGGSTSSVFTITVVQGYSTIFLYFTYDIVNNSISWSSSDWNTYFTVVDTLSTDYKFKIVANTGCVIDGFRSSSCSIAGINYPYPDNCIVTLVTTTSNIHDGQEIIDDLYTNKVDTSAITTSVTSSSTDAQVPSAKAVNDKLGGLSVVKLTESEYTALVTKDSNTLYVVVPDPSN